jgi:hypothetical protein
MKKTPNNYSIFFGLVLFIGIIIYLINSKPSVCVQIDKIRAIEIAGKIKNLGKKELGGRFIGFLEIQNKDGQIFTIENCNHFEVFSALTKNDSVYKKLDDTLFEYYRNDILIGNMYWNCD